MDKQSNFGGLINTREIGIRKKQQEKRQKLFSYLHRVFVWREQENNNNNNDDNKFLNGRL